MANQNIEDFSAIVSVIRLVSPSEALDLMAMSIGEALKQQVGFDCAALCKYCKMIEDGNPSVLAPERSRLGTEQWYHYFTDVDALCSASLILEKNYQYYLE